MSVNVGYLSGVSSRVMYSGVHTDWVRAQYQWAKDVAPHAISNPTLGLYSETANRSGDQEQKVNDTITDVLMGRKSLDDFTSAVQEWKDSAGDQIRDEYQDQLS